MRLIKFTLPGLIIMILCAGMAWAQEPFQLAEPDLEQFIKDVPRFLEIIEGRLPPPNQDPGREAMLVVFGERENRAARQVNWDPAKFNRIMDRVILGGIMMEMGGYGEGRLRYMVEQRAKLQKSAELSPQQKEKQLAQLDRDIAALAATSEIAKAIPTGDLHLMWKYRKELKAAMWGKVLAKPKVMKNF